MRFSRRASWLTAPNALAVKLETMRRKGARILDLTESNPTRLGFDYLKADLLKPFQDPGNLMYDPDPHGLLSARDAICAYYAAKGISLSPEQIFLTASTSEAYTLVFRLAAEAGDTLFAPQPGYPLLDYLASINDLAIARYPLIYENAWHVDHAYLRGSVPDRVAAVLTVNPNNPTGNFVRESERTALRAFCREKQAALIADEVFFDFAYAGKNLREVASCTTEEEVLTFTLSGISKILGLPQMKLAWLVVTGPSALRQQAIERLEIISDTYLSASTPVQRALPAWFARQGEILAEIRGRITQNRRFLEANTLSREVRGGTGVINVLNAEGGWYAVLTLSPGQNDESYALRLLEEERVLTHPGYLFDFPEGAAFLVISLLVPPEIFKEGVKRISNLRTGS